MSHEYVPFILGSRISLKGCTIGLTSGAQVPDIGTEMSPGHHKRPTSEEGRADLGLTKSENEPEILHFSLTLGKRAECNRRDVSLITPSKAVWPWDHTWPSGDLGLLPKDGVECSLWKFSSLTLLTLHSHGGLLPSFFCSTCLSRAKIWSAYPCKNFEL